MQLIVEGGCSVSKQHLANENQGTLFITREENPDWGGIWTGKKKQALSDYLKAFRSALKYQNFSTWYIDAFAGTGTGDHLRIKSLAEVLPELASEKDQQQYSYLLKGSALIALGITPPFDKYVFIEKNPANARHLEEMIRDNAPPSTLSPQVINGCANNELPKIICTQFKDFDRGVVFLDPFGMELKWETLEKIATCGARFDICYLFPTGGLRRFLARSGISASLRPRLEDLLGEEGLIQAERHFYSKPSHEQRFLFNEIPQIQHGRDMPIHDRTLEQFVEKRLKTIFPYVCEHHLSLYNGKQTLLFTLFFAMTNHERKAHTLMHKFLRSIVKSSRERG